MIDPRWSRRGFLQAAGLAALMVAAGRSALAGSPPADARPTRLDLLNLHTGERLVTTVKDETGIWNLEAMAEIDRLLRCHYTGEVHPIDRRTLDFLQKVDAAYGGGREIHIISGYRSPVYNDLLRQEGQGVARNSLHLRGQAIDLRFPGIDLDRVRRTATALCLGGVGYYPRSGFVHLDAGKVRCW